MTCHILDLVRHYDMSKTILDRNHDIKTKYMTFGRILYDMHF